MFDFKNGKNRFSPEGGLSIITCEIVITNYDLLRLIIP